MLRGMVELDLDGFVKAHRFQTRRRNILTRTGRLFSAPFARSSYGPSLRCSTGKGPACAFLIA